MKNVSKKARKEAINFFEENFDKWNNRKF
jgi:hypothetical protein